MCIPFPPLTVSPMRGHGHFNPDTCIIDKGGFSSRMLEEFPFKHDQLQLHWGPGAAFSLGGVRCGWVGGGGGVAALLLQSDNPAFENLPKYQHLEVGYS